MHDCDDHDPAAQVGDEEHNSNPPAAANAAARAKPVPVGYARPPLTDLAPGPAPAAATTSRAATSPGAVDAQDKHSQEASEKTDVDELP